MSISDISGNSIAYGGYGRSICPTLSITPILQWFTFLLAPLHVLHKEPHKGRVSLLDILMHKPWLVSEDVSQIITIVLYNDTNNQHMSR